MKDTVRRGGTEAFTLVEVLIAITIFAVAVSMVYGLYSSIISVVHNVEEQAVDHARIRVTLEQVSDDLRLLYRGGQGSLLGSEPKSLVSNDSFLAFTTSSHLSFTPDAPPVSATLVRYYLRPDEDDETFSLYRSESPLLPGSAADVPDGGRPLVLCEGLAEITVNYIDRDGREFSEWDSRRQEQENEDEPDRWYPMVVTIELVFAGPDEDDEEANGFSTSVFLRPARLSFAE